MRLARQTLLTLTVATLAVAAAGCDGDGKSTSKPTSKPAGKAGKTAKGDAEDASPRAIRVFYWKEDLRERLDDLQFYVTQKSGTERAFNNTFWDNKKAGVYVDVVSGEPLFSSLEKFKSGTGWPSYYKPLVGWNVTEKTDASHGMARVEVRSRFADSHLGHVFKDGPPPTGLRYCINSAALRFIPVKELEAEGYGRFARLFDKDGKESDSSEAKAKVVVIAAGCFWCLEAIMDAQPGVITAESGYSGGHTSKPSYKDVCGGKTGHTESVRVTYDPAKTDLAKLLAVFLKSFDATDGRGVKPDFGDQYRPAIFYEDKAQLAAARAALTAEKTRLGVKSLAVGLEPLTTFWRAEGYHQDYVKKHPDKRYVKSVSYERMDRVGVKHP